MDIKFETLGKIIVQVLGSDKNIYTIYYITEGDYVWYKKREVFYGIGDYLKWRKITRDLNVDFVKGIQVSESKKLNLRNVTLEAILKITIYGSGFVDKFSLSSNEDVTMFMKAAKWLLKFQDSKGGWSVNVTRKIAKIVLMNPGWYSAMGQGQAISLLCRAFNFTSNQVYLKAALKGLKLFVVDIKDGGITSTVMGKYKMYEEYPSEPSLHVLNGFIFSLIGLYDLSKLSKKHIEAERLFQQGLKTLLNILPMYDNGHGTFYDLRHIVVPGHKPNRARWDYHAVHIKQLQLLNQIHPHKTFESILKRWIAYASGIPAPHN